MKLKLLLSLLLILLFHPDLSLKTYGGKSKYRIQIVNAGPDGSPWAKVGANTKKHFETTTNKEVTAKSYNGGILGDEVTTVERCKNGKLNFWAGSAGAVATIIPELALLEMPFLFLNDKELDEIIFFNTEKQIIKLLENNGFKLFMPLHVGWRHMATVKKPILKMEDLKDLSMRSQQNSMYIKMWKTLGANPIPMGVTEVTKALNIHKISGFDNTPTFTFATGWFQFIKFYSLTKHVYQPGLCVFNKNFFDSVPIELAKKFMKVDDRTKIMSDGNKIIRDYVVNEVYPIFEKLNIKIIKISEEERLRFKSKLSNLYSFYTKSTTPDGKKLLQNVLLRLKTMRKK